MNSPSLAMNDKIELDNLCPTTATEVVEKPFRGQLKRSGFRNTTGRTELMILHCALLFPLILSMEMANTGA